MYSFLLLRPVGWRQYDIPQTIPIVDQVQLKYTRFMIRAVLGFPGWIVWEHAIQIDCSKWKPQMIKRV